MGRKRVRDNWEDSAWINNRTYNYYLNRLRSLAMNRFIWSNLPPTVDARFLEMSLLETGSAVFFLDETIGYLALTVMYGAPLNVYRIPTRRTAYATNGYQAYLDETNSVLIWDNYAHEPIWNPLMLFARRLYEIERSMDTNVKGQKFPILIVGDESQKLTMKNLYMEYDGNQPVIYGAKGIEQITLNAINTQTPYVADKLELLKKQIWSEALTFLGIENSVSEKKERMIEGEMNANLGAVEAERNTALNARRQAAQEINAMFGLNIQVNFRTGFDTIRTPIAEEAPAVQPSITGPQGEEYEVIIDE